MGNPHHSGSHGRMEIIVLGDFNGVVNPSLDRRHENRTATLHVGVLTAPTPTHVLEQFFTHELKVVTSETSDNEWEEFQERLDVALPAALCLLAIWSYDSFIKMMSENFGLQSAYHGAEAQLHTLKQEVSAKDYANKFLEMTAETDWFRLL
ncbi:hypothetical protein EDD11_002393 [Mortierella claussenii]|nr:hypothetical protein EDD11_002393 [Mortierella claussenii]